MSIREHKFDDMEKLIGGQPLWYWCLSFARRREVDAERATKAGTTYVRDASRDGLKPDGSLDDKFATERKRAAALRIGPRMKEKIEQRAKAR